MNEVKDLKDVCWKGYTAIGLKNKGGRKVPNCVKESIDKKDTITFDIPLLIRVFELVREDIKTDADLHRVVECLINIRNKGVLTMDNYDEIAHLKESVDSGEYDYEGDMAKVQLQTLCRNSKDLIDMLDDNENMPEWVQSKITLAQDYITTVRDYLQSKQELGESLDETAAWQRKDGKDPKGGLNRKGIASYRRENPGSKLSMAVTTKPSKLDPDSKSAKRRKSFCARMGGMKKRLTSKETAKDPDSRINKALRKWNC
jgi:hypothetical protein